MALEFDGFDAWHAIAESPDTFASLRADAAKSARAALVKYLKTKTLVSDTVVERSTLSCFRPVGRIAVSGRSTPMEVFEPVFDFSEDRVQQFTDIFRRYDAGDESALAEFEKMAAENPDDKALANLIERLREVGPGGYSALDK